MTMPCVNRGFDKTVDCNFSSVWRFYGGKVELKKYNITCFNSLVLNVVFSATYSLESHNAITIHFVSQNFVNKRANWLFGLYRTSTSLLGKKLH